MPFDLGLPLSSVDFVSTVRCSFHYVITIGLHTVFFFLWGWGVGMWSQIKSKSKHVDLFSLLCIRYVNYSLPGMYTVDHGWKPGKIPVSGLDFLG